MSENTLMDILKRACDKQVKVMISSDSNSLYQGLIVDIGDDYVKIKWSSKEREIRERFIKLSSIESISTSWRVDKF